MKTYDELLTYYNAKLLPIIQKLEIERTEIRRYEYFAYAAMVGITLIPLAVFYVFDVELSLIPVLIYLFLAIFVFSKSGIERNKYHIENYNQSFKDRIIKPLIHTMDDSFTYTPDHSVALKVLWDSKIFVEKIDSFTGNDHVKGIVEGVPFQFSDIKLMQRHTSSSAKYGRKVKWSTLFRGALIIAEFNKHIKGTTVICPADRQNHRYSNEILIKMDSPEFEKVFNVYATDVIEAHYVLTHTVMDKLLELRKLTKQNLFFSFIKGDMYIAIDFGYDLYEAPIKVPIANRVIQYIHALQISTGIVEEFKLNEKLWSKG